MLKYAGGRVRATGSHSVFVFDESGRIVAKPVSDLCFGRYHGQLLRVRAREAAAFVDVEACPAEGRGAHRHHREVEAVLPALHGIPAPA